jgi:hypothetical protein
MGHFSKTFLVALVPRVCAGELLNGLVSDRRVNIVLPFNTFYVAALGYLIGVDGMEKSPFSAKCLS